MGMCYMNLDEFAKAELNFNKSQAVYNILKIDASEPLKLQKGILYKNKGKTELASKLFNEIISKSDIEDIYKSKAEALYQMGTLRKA